MSSQEQELIGKLLNPHNRRDFIRRAGALGLSASALTAFLEACGSTSSTTTTGSGQTINLSGPIDVQTLMTKAKAEGGLQAVGIPPEWADYKEMLANYASLYVPIDYKADAEFSSAQEVEVFKQSVHHAYGDIADVGFIWGPVVIQDNLVSPYKHSYWNDIPANLKDPNGNWCVEYWGAQSLVINTDKVKNPPKSFADLLNNSYPNMVGIDGDRRFGSGLCGSIREKRQHRFYPAWHRLLCRVEEEGELHAGPRKRCEYDDRRGSYRHHVGLPGPGFPRHIRR